MRASRFAPDASESGERRRAPSFVGMGAIPGRSACPPGCVFAVVSDIGPKARGFSAVRGRRGELYFRHAGMYRCGRQSAGGEDAMSPDRATEPTRHGLATDTGPGLLQRRVRVALGQEPGDLLVTGARGRQRLHSAHRAGRRGHRRRLDRRRRPWTRGGRTGRSRPRGRSSCRG